MKEDLLLAQKELESVKIEFDCSKVGQGCA